MKIFRSQKEENAMKNNKKKVFVAALAVCLIAVISMGTLAWFTAEDDVTNKFYVADSNTPDAEGIFGIDVWEKDENGNVISKGDSDEGMVFEEIIAGDKLIKEPHLENTGIHPMWVRATVTVTGADVLKEAIGGIRWFAWENLFAGKDDGQWVVDSAAYNPDTKEIKYVLYYQQILAEDAFTTQLFNTVLIPTGLTVEQAERLDSFNVSIFGEAIQSENLGVSSAKEAFAKYWEEANTPTKALQADAEFSGDITPATMSKPLSWTAIDGEWSSDPAKAEALFVAGPNSTNGTFHFAGGNYTMQDGDYLVKAEDGAGAIVVYVWDAITVNGVEVPRNEVEKYFDSDVLVFVQY